MKKRIVVMLLTFVMAVSTLAGCSGTTMNPEGKVTVGQDEKDVKDEKDENHKDQKDSKDEKVSIVEKYAKKQAKEDKKRSWGDKAANVTGGIMIQECEEVYVSDSATGYCEGMVPVDMPEFNTEEYSAISENGFQRVALSPLSTFSADVDTASYSNVRRLIRNGYGLGNIPKGAVRTEEFLNYFTYDYKQPEEGEPFGITTEIAPCPWNEKAQLLRVGLQTQAIDFSEAPASNIVFLIDVSGSMYDENKLPLLVKSFKVLLDELGEKDRVSIVTYAGEDKVVLQGVPASDKETIIEALDGLKAGGGTNGGQGILSAYRLAEENFLENGNNRVILATDGDLNIGVTNSSDLKDLIREESESGIFLTILGFGMGNYSDTNLETMADAGNGNYAYIDTLAEARKVLCENLGATMVTVAKDVKLQMEFNPAVVSSYRLIGYEDRLLNAEDFRDDKKDAGEVGAGHCVTAMYEIITVDAKEVEEEQSLRYQENHLTSQALESEEWMTLSIRYKEPMGDTSKLLEYPIGMSSYNEKASEDFVFAANVALFAQLLRGEEYVSGYSVSDVRNNLEGILLKDEYRNEFYNLVKTVE